MSSESEKSPVAKRILIVLCVLMVLGSVYVGGYFMLFYVQKQFIMYKSSPEMPSNLVPMLHYEANYFTPSNTNTSWLISLYKPLLPFDKKLRPERWGILDEDVYVFLDVGETLEKNRGLYCKGDLKLVWATDNLAFYEADGAWTIFYPHGQKYREENYKSWKRHGMFTEWKKNGELIAEEFYIHGKEVAKSEWEAYEAGQKSESPK